MTSRRWLLPVVVATVVAGTGGAVAALAGGRVQDPQPVTRAEIFYGTGPSALYSGDTGGIGEVAPLRVSTPSGAAAYDAVVEVSYDARTRGPGPFVLGISVDTGATGDDGGPDDPTADDLRTRPTGPVAVDPDTDGPATARWLVRGLEPGTTYDVTPAANSSSRGRGTNAVRLRDVLVTVELAPGTR